MAPVTDLATLLKRMTPVRQPGVYVFSSVAADTVVDVDDHAMILHEREGLTLITEASRARALGLAGMFRAAWITLTVHSDLAAVGLTAAVSAALTDAGISCNVVAGAYHDHLFVPPAAVDNAMRILVNLQQAPEHGPALSDSTIRKTR